MRNTAHATENAPASRARLLVALEGAKIVKPRKITTSHTTSAISNGFEIDETAGEWSISEFQIGWVKLPVRIAA